MMMLNELLNNENNNITPNSQITTADIGSTPTNAEQPPKRKYSRNGCNECKKRRIKCDENKPKCWQCSRLSRECVYQLNRRNKPRVSKSKMVIQTQQFNVHSQTISEPLSINNNFGFTFNDLNLLYSDLNNLVNWRLEEALTPNLRSYIGESTNPFNKELENLIPTTLDKNEIVFNNPITNFNLGDPHNYYLSGFYNQFCTLICPFTPNPGQNPVRDVLLHYAHQETYLMYAILACGARILYHETKSSQDDQAYCSYLSSCLDILGEEFKNKNDNKSGNVEPLLLTILLLTSDAASSKNRKWRSHLKGAKELLINTKIQSDTLNFCRNWLITYEILAGISNPFGGIFQNDEELDKIIANDELYLISLKRLNMLDSNGFNYLGGHVIGLDLAFRDIIKMLNKIRDIGPTLNNDDDTYLNFNFKNKIISFDQVADVLTKLRQCEAISIIDKTGIITEDNPIHPLNNQISQSFNSIDILHFPNDTKLTYSWFDVANQCHIIAGYITLLVKVLHTRKESVLVQDLVQKGVKFLEFLKVMDTYDNVCMAHLHMMADSIGKVCIKKDDQQLIEKYLGIIYEKFGLASAGHNVNKLRKVWNGEVLNEEEEDVLTW